MIDFIRAHPREFRISIIFGIFNVILPLGLVTWFFNRATDVRNPIVGFSEPRNEPNPWMIFFVFVVILVVISIIQIRVFRIQRDDIATYFVPCGLALVFVTLNILIPASLLGWATQDFADRGLGIYSDPPNPANPARPIFRLVFAFVVSGLILFTEVFAVRALLARRYQ